MVQYKHQPAMFSLGGTKFYPAGVFTKEEKMGCNWIKACVCFLLFAALDVDAAYLANRSLLYGLKAPVVGWREKTITLPGGEEIELVWQWSNDGPGFWIGKCEVTQAQWYGVMGSSPSSLKAQNRAVEYVSWEDCQEFCRRAGKGLRLPTEKEWVEAQKAARRHGYKEASSYSDCKAIFKNHSWRLVCHMRDNVWEWCAEGVCRKDCESRSVNSKSCRSEGLGFRVCCSPGPLDKFHPNDVKAVLVAIPFLLLLFVCCRVDSVRRRKAKSGSTQV